MNSIIDVHMDPFAKSTLLQHGQTLTLHRTCARMIGPFLIVPDTDTALDPWSTCVQFVFVRSLLSSLPCLGHTSLYI